LIRSVKPGRRRRAVTEESGLFVRTKAFQDRSLTGLALWSTIKAAFNRPAFDRRRRPLSLSPVDLRKKVRERRTGYSVVFVVDASSSMRVRDRISLVKGLLRGYLRECYLRRDRVALVSFRHQQSRVLLPFTGNPGRAQKTADLLPVGGKTPLAEGLRLAFRALVRERFQYPRTEPVIVLLSDGKPNLSFADLDPVDEAFQAADGLQRNGITLVFIDTEDNPLAFGCGPAIARKARGVYRRMIDLVRQ
jgi:magnesium chelatase subunit D